MHGNVWEWCKDEFHADYNHAPTDGSVWLSESSNMKVLRGVSWYYYPDLCRSASRLYFFVSREFRDTRIGVRVVCVVPRTT